MHIWGENAVKLLGILIDSNLTFNDHLKIICKKASKKLTAISRLYFARFKTRRFRARSLQEQSPMRGEN